MSLAEQLQSAERLQFASNLAHWIEGGLFAAIAVIALLQALGYINSKAARYIWPTLIILGGLFLPVYIAIQGEVKVGLLINDPQQIEHALIAFLLVLAGSAEILLVAGIFQRKFWRFIAPAALAAIGIILFVHTEYGTPEAVAEAVSKHRYQGAMVMLVGLLKSAEVQWQRTIKWLAYPWIVALFITAILLITYREPKGAYLTQSATQKFTDTLRSRTPLGTVFLARRLKYGYSN